MKIFFVALSSLIIVNCSGTVEMYEDKSIKDEDVATIIPEGVQITSVDDVIIKPPKRVRLRNTSIKMLPGKHSISILVDDGNQFNRNISSSIKVPIFVDAGSSYIVKPIYHENAVWCPTVIEKTKHTDAIITSSKNERYCHTYNPEGGKGFDISASFRRAFCSPEIENNVIVRYRCNIYIPSVR